MSIKDFAGDVHSSKKILGVVCGSAREVGGEEWSGDNRYGGEQVVATTERRTDEVR